MLILGISAYYHDSAAALIKDGNIIGAAQEERFTRKKHDANFPTHAIRFCISEAKINLCDIHYIVFYEKPLLKFDRLIETHLAYAPSGFHPFHSAMSVWLESKLHLKRILKRELSRLGNCKANSLPPILFNTHHQSHASSAFFPSPFNEAAVLCLDGVGEWATTTGWIGKGNSLKPLWQMNFPHSLGLLYSAFTSFSGFRVNSGEYKLMGLAPFGEPKYTNLILNKLLDLKDDGSFRINMDYFDYATGMKMTNDLFAGLFDSSPRKPESAITQFEMDVAASIQNVTEKIVLRLVKTIKNETGQDNLCLAGGVAHNCVVNGKIFRNKVFEKIWVQPASGDSGGAIGAAFSVWHQKLERPRANQAADKMLGTYLGPQYSSNEVASFLDAAGAKYEKLDRIKIFNKTASLIANGNVVGWFQGRMEFGPRALGSRSILGDPRDKSMQSKINQNIKYRESFRPFAPSVLSDRVSDYFELDEECPYMTLVSKINKSMRIKVDAAHQNKAGLETLKLIRSKIPAVTHIDYSARVQTVKKEENSDFHALLEAFDSMTDCPVLVNTSFNIRGEPIVCSPSDAYQCFMNTEMNHLVIENFLLSKKDQPQTISRKDTKYDLNPPMIHSRASRIGLLAKLLCTSVALSLIYFFIFTPTALILRLLGRDVLGKTFDPTIKSYLVTVDQTSKANLEKMY